MTHLKKIAMTLIIALFVWTTVGCSLSPGTTQKNHSGPYQIGMLPKFTSDPYFKAVNQGAQDAAKELGVKLDFNGPVNADVTQQSDIINRWIQSQYDAITVSANDPDAIVPALQNAKSKGIKTSTFDADVKKEGRDVFLMPVTFEDMGKTMVEMMAKQTGGKGKFLVVTAVLTAPNQNAWIKEMKKYMKKKYPQMSIEAILPGNEDLAQSRNVALNYLRSHPDTNGVFCVTGIATPGVAEAVEQLGLKKKVVVTGLGVPNLVRKYIKNGTIQEVCLWDPKNLGYATIHLVKAQLDGTLNPKSKVFKAGKLGELKFVNDDTVLLGPPTIFNKENIDQYNF